jgi:hypothetical protein
MANLWNVLKKAYALLFVFSALFAIIFVLYILLKNWRDILPSITLLLPILITIYFLYKYTSVPNSFLILILLVSRSHETFCQQTLPRSLQPFNLQKKIPVGTTLRFLVLFHSQHRMEAYELGLRSYVKGWNYVEKSEERR